MTALSKGYSVFSEILTSVLMTLKSSLPTELASLPCITVFMADSPLRDVVPYTPPRSVVLCQAQALTFFGTAYHKKHLLNSISSSTLRAQRFLLYYYALISQKDGQNIGDSSFYHPTYSGCRHCDFTLKISMYIFAFYFYAYIFIFTLLFHWSRTTSDWSSSLDYPTYYEIVLCFIGLSVCALTIDRSV
jgi:hypothetical protein